jgi:hypothetical protein
MENAMRKLLSLALLSAATASTVGCCGFDGMGGCFGHRRNACEPYAAPAMEPCGQPCDACGAPGGAVITTPAPVVTPGPATYSSGYLPR